MWIFDEWILTEVTYQFQEAWVVERMGKYHRILDPGLNILIPLLDKIKYVQSLKEIAIDIPQQTAITIGKSHFKTYAMVAWKINPFFQI